MTEYTVDAALAEIGDLVRCRCHPAYKDRKLRDPECDCDTADAVSLVAAEVARLTAERDALRAAQFRQNRLHELNAEALAEIKATVDGKSDQPVRDIIYGLLEEINNLGQHDETAV